MKAAAVLNILREWCGENHYHSPTIVGGYARDTFFGIKPNDIDVCITSRNFNNHKQVFNHMGILSRFLSKMGIGSAVMQAYYRVSEGQFNEMLYGVMKVECSDYNIDLLFSKLDTTGDYVDAFECNINQYVMDSLIDKPRYTGSPDYNPVNCKQLWFLRSDTPDSRKEKMMLKWGAIKDTGKYNAGTSY